MDSWRRFTRRGPALCFAPAPCPLHAQSPSNSCPTASPAANHVSSPEPDADAEGREGHLRPLDGVRMVRSARDVYIPITQQSLPVTEDMICQQQEAFSKLGTSKEAHKIRTRMQTVSLKVRRAEACCGGCHGPRAAVMHR